MTTEHSGSGDLSRSMALLWGVKDREKDGRGPGPKPGLTLDRIVETAIRVADAEGLVAVSMRRVATDLGVGAMSLYRYVPGKAELLDLMLDKVGALQPEQKDELSGRQKITVISMIDAMVSGLARGHVNALQAEARTGVSDTEFWEAQRPALEQALLSGCYPRIFALGEDAFSTSGEDVLEFALGRLLDGLEVCLGD